MTEVKSKKDRLVKNPMGNPPQSLKALIRSAISSTLLFHCLHVLSCTCLSLESKILTVFRIYCFILKAKKKQLSNFLKRNHCSLVTLVTNRGVSTRLNICISGRGRRSRLRPTSLLSSSSTDSSRLLKVPISTPARSTMLCT